jgi:hypothetical protein
MSGVLCYVEGAFAYFTTQPLEKQWGDDWNDAPYEHNAGRPYEWREDYDGKNGKPRWEITKVAFESPLETPSDMGGINSGWSVEQINAKETAWLTDPAYGQRPRITRPVVWAGVTIDEFIRLIETEGGTVYLPRADTMGQEGT